MLDTPALRLRGAAASVAGRPLWRDLDLELAPGELVAVTGPNGSGKTTLLRAVLGLHRLDTGSLAIAGMPVRRGRRVTGFVPQAGRPVDAGLRGRDLVALALGGTRPGLPWATARERAEIDALLERVDASALGDRPVARLSGGELQRIRLAQALAGSPRLLLLDEPLLALDDDHRAALIALLARERDAAAVGVLVVTHDLDPFAPLAAGVLHLPGGGEPALRTAVRAIGDAA